MSEIINHNEKSALSEFFDFVKSKLGRENFLKYLNGENGVSSDGPFLSVIMRTQGRRPEALSEVLLCMCGQSDMDFEVLIMGHNLDDEGRNSANTIIDELPSYMNGKVKLVEVNGGNRTTPLNEGFKAANGRYISILDDDDIVLENWVEVFHKLEEKNRGKILHSYCVSQDWKSVQNAYGETELISVSPFKPLYCREFDVIRQLSVNSCPTFSLAFPSAAFKLLGIHFDESLTTTEDWDFLMRNALLCGVADEPTVTGIYRIWVNTENSATLHNENEWQKNYKYIQNKLLENPVLIPPKSIREIIAVEGSSSESAGIKINEFMVLLDNGSGFDNSTPLKLTFSAEGCVWTAECNDVPDFGEVKRIRIDPIVKGSVTLKGFRLRAYDIERNKIEYKINKFRTNGVFTKDFMIFVGLDPQCVIDLKTPVKISSLAVDFAIEYDVPINFYRFGVIKYCAKKWTLGILRRIKNFAVRFKN